MNEMKLSSVTQEDRKVLFVMLFELPFIGLLQLTKYLLNIPDTRFLPLHGIIIEVAIVLIVAISVAVLGNVVFNKYLSKK
jgi:hypothetical protein